MSDRTPPVPKKGHTPKKASFDAKCGWCDKVTTNVGWNCIECGHDFGDPPPDIHRDREKSELFQKSLHRKAMAAVDDLETWEL